MRRLIGPTSLPARRPPRPAHAGLAFAASLALAIACAGCDDPVAGGNTGGVASNGGGNGPTTAPADSPAFAPPPVASGPHRYAAGFSLTLPPTWQTRQNNFGMALTSVAPPDGPKDDFRENLNVQIVDNAAGLDAAAFAARQFDPERAKKMFRKFEPVGAMDWRAGTHPAKRIVFRHRGAAKEASPSRPLKVLVYMILAGDKGYVITCTAAADRFDAYVAHFEQICQSFEPG